VTIREVLINLLKSLFPNGELSGKVIRNPYLGPSPKVNQFFRLVEPIIMQSFNEIS